MVAVSVLAVAGWADKKEIDENASSSHFSQSVGRSVGRRVSAGATRAEAGSWAEQKSSISAGAERLKERQKRGECKLILFFSLLLLLLLLPPNQLMDSTQLDSTRLELSRGLISSLLTASSLATL